MLSNEAREKLDTGKFDFPVTERAIQTVGASTVVPFDVGRAIYRLDTNETIAKGQEAGKESIKKSCQSR